MSDADAAGEEVRPGDVVWVAPEIAVGREQAGRRPALVVAGDAYLRIVGTRVIVVPITTVDRGWPNHIEVIGSRLAHRSWAMSEQVRAVSRTRITDRAGRATDVTVAAVRSWIADFLDL